MAKPQQLALLEGLSQKHSGAYFTPADVAATLVRWAIRRPTDRMLDPSCGDGAFLSFHRRSVGIEQDAGSAAAAIERAPWALVHEGDFFAWAANTRERFECIAGNPPFIRYHQFQGEVRARALALCEKLGATFSGLSSSWAPFLVAAAGRLERGGRMSFVVPAEIGHAPYAKPLLEFLFRSFERTQIIAIQSKLFPGLSEDCWLLYAEGYGGASESLHLTVVDSFVPTPHPPRATTVIPVAELRDTWKMRLRPYLLSQQVRDCYANVSRMDASFRLSSVASVGIGYVSGDNDFFHLRPSAAEKLSIPDRFLLPTVRNGRSLPAGALTQSIVRKWYRDDEPMLLLKLPKTTRLPVAIQRYLDTDGGLRAREAYKCRKREPWYSVPDVKTPDFFLTYMSGRDPMLVRNDTTSTCTNSVHAVRFNDARAIPKVREQWGTPFLQLSCELEGHPLGGGMLKLEPREAGNILIPGTRTETLLPGGLLTEAVDTMRQWRHYASN